MCPLTPGTVGAVARPGTSSAWLGASRMAMMGLMGSRNGHEMVLFPRALAFNLYRGAAQFADPTAGMKNPVVLTPIHACTCWGWNPDSTWTKQLTGSLLRQGTRCRSISWSVFPCFSGAKSLLLIFIYNMYIPRVDMKAEWSLQCPVGKNGCGLGLFILDDNSITRKNKPYQTLSNLIKHYQTWSRSWISNSA